MSTYQPPGEPPSYAQPQDPWAGTQGVASAPTDPIPQAAAPYGQFAPGVAAPSVWTQETVSHGHGYDYVPQQRSRLGMYVLVVLAVIVFGGGGGYGAYRWITSMTPTTPTQPVTSSSAGTSAPGSSGPGATPTVAASALNVGDCIFNIGTPTKPEMIRSECSKPKSYKIIKINSGELIPEGPAGTFDDTVTAPAMCAGTGYEAFYGWDSSDDKQDYFFCLTVN